MPPKDVWKNVHTSVIHHSARLETTQMSVSRRMSKEIRVYCKTRGTNYCDTQQTWMNLTDTPLRERRQTWMNECICTDIRPVWFRLYEVQNRLASGRGIVLAGQREAGRGHEGPPGMLVIFLVFIWGVCVMGVFTWWKIRHFRLCTLCVYIHMLTLITVNFKYINFK